MFVQICSSSWHRLYLCTHLFFMEAVGENTKPTYTKKKVQYSLVSWPNCPLNFKGFFFISNQMSKKVKMKFLITNWPTDVEKIMRWKQNVYVKQSIFPSVVKNVSETHSWRKLQSNWTISAPLVKVKAAWSLWTKKKRKEKKRLQLPRCNAVRNIQPQSFTGSYMQNRWRQIQSPQKLRYMLFTGQERYEEL